LRHSGENTDSETDCSHGAQITAEIVQLMDKIKIFTSSLRQETNGMPNSKDTITNRLKRALVEIAESPVATAQEKLDAVGLFLKARKLAKQRDRITPSKQKKRKAPVSTVWTCC
jgi:hypothetical protein